MQHKQKRFISLFYVKKIIEKLLTVFTPLSVDRKQGGVQHAVWRYGGWTLEPSAFVSLLCCGSGWTLAIWL